MENLKSIISNPMNLEKTHKGLDRTFFNDKYYQEQGSL